MKVQYITRKGNFDSGHRVMNEFMKCYNIHGHTYLYELTFSFENMEEIGYAIDFKEIKKAMEGPAFHKALEDLIFKNLVEEALSIVKAPAGTFDSIPPPVKYLTVKVVFEGAIP